MNSLIYRVGTTLPTKGFRSWELLSEDFAVLLPFDYSSQQHGRGKELEIILQSSSQDNGASANGINTTKLFSIDFHQKTLFKGILNCENCELLTS